MTAIIERDKLEVIETINGIRVELGKEPYDTDYLGRFSKEQLQDMVDKLFDEREGAREKTHREKESAKEDFFKTLIVGFVAVSVLVIVISIVMQLTRA